MARIDIKTTAWSTITISLIRREGSAGLCTLGVIAALMTAPSALADPQDPAPPPPPAYGTATQAAASGDPTPTPTEVPHLSSPENLPPGTTDAPVGPPQGSRLSHLRELWDALQTQDVSKKDALILILAQRPLDPNALPPPGVSPGPQPPPTEPPPPTP